MGEYLKKKTLKKKINQDNKKFKHITIEIEGRDGESSYQFLFT